MLGFNSVGQSPPLKIQTYAQPESTNSEKTDVLENTQQRPFAPKKEAASLENIHDFLCVLTALVGLGTFAACDMPYSLFGLIVAAATLFYFVFSQMELERNHPEALAKLPQTSDAAPGVV